MNKIVSALVVACAGAAAASLLSWQRKQSEAKAMAKEDISRWEDDGGTVMTPQGVAPQAPTS